MRRAAIAAALAVGLAGCPIPQPLPDYPAGTVTPPRILMDKIVTATDWNPNLSTDGNPIIFVPANCTTAQVYRLSAYVNDPITFETVDSRWFVNYDPRSSDTRMWAREDPVPPNSDSTDLNRAVPPASAPLGPSFEFFPYDHSAAPGAPPATGVTGPGGTTWYPDPGILRVVELVVSNGFDATPTATPPNRATLPSFETQIYRWVFLSVPASAAVPCH
jgi:hypothetical protein